ncbi:MAG: 3-hydroxyacyl-ACP dehydratase FabZ [Maricaulaceae bacterium]|nr:3-hydroxyacyl-ACP dehydratase FabZ [Maricaulaceae bacterium]
MSEAETQAAAGEAIGPDEILRRLPHRYPFLLVDRAEDYIPGKSITGIKCVTANEPFFPGHFPGNPVMPGVLIIEALAQAGALLMSKTLNADTGKTVILFMSVDNARFRRPVRPGDVLELKVEVTYARHGVFKYTGMALVDGQRAAQCEFAAKAMDL